MPPLRDMVVARTLDIDRLVRQQINDGVAQLVIAGVGYDMRPLRLLAGREVEVFELDLPHVHADPEQGQTPLAQLAEPACALGHLHPQLIEVSLPTSDA